jgi:hypothetical protein
MGIGDESSQYLDLGRAMLSNYARFDNAEHLFDEVLAVNVEERSFVDILDPRRRKMKDRPLLTGKLDLVVTIDDDIWIMDHKTASSKPSHGALDVDPQITAYCYVWWRITGDLPRGALYNVLMKRTPKAPALLANGKLSVDKRWNGTYGHYMDAIKEYDLDPGDYAEMLDTLRKRGWNDFFIRDGMTRTKAELLSYERRLYRDYLEAKRVLKRPDDLAVANPSQRLCATCGVRALCLGYEQMLDVDYLKETMFHVKPARYEAPQVDTRSGAEDRR